MSSRRSTVLLADDHAIVTEGLRRVLEQDRLRLFESVLHGEDGGHGEGVFVGIDVVVGTIKDINMDIDDRVAGDDAVGHRCPC